MVSDIPPDILLWPWLFEKEIASRKVHLSADPCVHRIPSLGSIDAPVLSAWVLT